ncbi:MAG: hypothetical protein IPF51_12850 [Dehalococcoidia bacterium]|nr:hypothetical protein [Dehalococcoidia bacterium]
MLRRLVAIVGATGAGKSAIALDLAQRLGGEIVNADSRQVYRRMDIGTAKPSVEDRRRVRHHLYDVADPNDGYNLALYQQQARETLEAIWAHGGFAWLVGGTGQYVWGCSKPGRCRTSSLTKSSGQGWLLSPPLKVTTRSIVGSQKWTRTRPARSTAATCGASSARWKCSKKAAGP